MYSAAGTGDSRPRILDRAAKVAPPNPREPEWTRAWKLGSGGGGDGDWSRHSGVWRNRISAASSATAWSSPSHPTHPRRCRAPCLLLLSRGCLSCGYGTPVSDIRDQCLPSPPATTHVPITTLLPYVTSMSIVRFSPRD